MELLHPQTRRVAFVALTGTIYLAALFVVARIPTASSPDVLALAVALDLTLVVPLLYYFLFLRGTGRLVGLAPVFLLSLAGAALVLPVHYRGMLPEIRLLALPAEIALAGYLLWKARALFRERAGDDVLENLQRSFRALLPPRLATVVAYEISVLYYALFSWRARPVAPEDAAFSYHRRSGYAGVVVALVTASAFEIVAVHLLLSRWSPAAAWVLTALGCYGVLWVLGDFQAMRLRPLRLTADALQVRVGLRWSVTIPFALIRSVAPRGRQLLSKRAPGYLHAAVLTQPRIILELLEPVSVQGPYGITKEVSHVGLAVDEADRLAAALHERMRR